MKKTRRQKAYRRGLRAESVTALYLMLKGYRILARRYKTPVGEIDLVARKGGRLVMVEVKTRSTLEEALEAVTPENRRRIENAARYFLASHPQFANDGVCFDVFAAAPPFYWRHLDNAWQARS